MPFMGLGVAIITPFTKDGSQVDFESFKRLIDYQIQGRVQAIIAVGTTGESPTLSHKEHREVIQFVVKYVNGRIPVIAGTGSNNTQEAIDLTKFAESAGANAVLVVNPYYNKPPQEGLYRHFRTVADATILPNIVYDIFGRTGVKIEPETRVRMLAGSENIVAFKEASGLEHFVECYGILSQARKEGRVKQGIKYFSGDDDITHQLIAEGGHGAISVLGNIDPRGVRELIDAALGRDEKTVELLLGQGGYMEKVEAVMKLSTNPIPIKAAAYAMGLIDNPALRLPLVQLHEVDPKKQRQLEETLRKYDLLRANS